MQKYCRKMKKRRVNFSLLRANEVGNTEALLSICGLQSLKYARSVVVHWPVDVFLLASVHVSTGQWKHIHWPVDDN